MTKASIVDFLHKKYGLTKKDIIFIVDQVFAEIRERIINGENVRLSSFGNFDVKMRGRRVGRNPKTGEQKVIAPRTIVKFRPSQLFKDEVNES
ncbi:MAG: integration host factor subunit alpha [Deferribacteraceae bacterium]|jgi:integration host factor subunit alpha|nr:integration host factor subunit alpha [Deferribacteraceae bacterium]